MNTPPVRTDREPIAKRFPRLGDFAAVHWQGGSLGVDSGGVPGPTDIYIHALVTLSPDARAEIVPYYQWEPAAADWDAEMSDQLRPLLPADGTWVSSDEFTEAVSTNKYYGRVYLDTASGTVYLDVNNT